MLYLVDTLFHPCPVQCIEALPSHLRILIWNGDHKKVTN